MLNQVLPRRVQEAVAEHAAEGSVWLVGGALRNQLLERPSTDFDFAVAGGALSLARRVADSLGADYFTLDAERGTGRVLPAGEAQDWERLDFAALRGETIEADLHARDFTVNALALALGEPAGKLLDPTGGLQDLRDRRLRLCSSGALQTDPVRALRAVRLAAQLEFRLDPALARALPQAAENLDQVSVERVRDELFSILEGPRTTRAMRVLQQLMLLKVLLPELGRSHAERAPAAMSEPLAVLRELEALLPVVTGEHDAEAAADLTLGQASLRLGRFRERLEQELESELSQGRSRRAILALAALYLGALGPAGFSELVGRAEAMRLSRAEVEHLRRLGKRMERSEDWRPAADDRRALYHFYQELGAAGVELVLLSLARFLAQRDGPPQQDQWEATVEAARDVLAPYLEDQTDIIDPQPLANGEDLMRELSLEPGPRLGELLEQIKEAQAAGEVSTRKQALRLAQRLIDRSELS